ncbi:MAG: type III-B CRISPR module RAMP protein Cmr6 [Candidatus Lokiarchaeota archaeon]|nr:type III-B CRISPR module RAMP protein Cmr6 [Candidatus Lokiarchaeota archaeon]
MTQNNNQIIPIPRDSLEGLEALNGKIDNFNLQLGKYVSYERGSFKFNFPEGKYNRFLSLKDYRKAFEYEIERNWKYVKISTFTALTASRLLVGLGNATVLENGLTLHHIHGFPYVPGSALKGILRNYIINTIFPNNSQAESDKNEKNSDEKLALEDIGFCDLFGCPKESIYKEARKGKIYFLDAFPSGEVTVEHDIMTPHYSEYYQSMEKRTPEPPADYYSTIPIPFVGVAGNTKFTFHVGVDKQDANLPVSENSKLSSMASTLLEVALIGLKEALQFHGVGAKSAVGYGYFYEFKEN